jgi:hypothetical protein
MYSVYTAVVILSGSAAHVAAQGGLPISGSFQDPDLKGQPAVRRTANQCYGFLDRAYCSCWHSRVHVTMP